MVKAASYANLTKVQVAQFNTISRYGLPQYITSDNAKNLNDDVLDALCL